MINITKLAEENPKALEARQLRDTYSFFGCEPGEPTFRYDIIDAVQDPDGPYLCNPTIFDIRSEVTTQALDDSGWVVEINEQEDGSYLVDPRISIRELNKALKIKLPYESAKTLNGLILENLQSFPQHNVSLKIEPIIIEIVQVSKQGVKLVRISKIY